jgi:hypothetical protein
MQTDKIIQKAYKMATGDDESISRSEPSYAKYVSILNDLQRDWYEEPLILPSERWASLEREETIIVSSDTQYDLDGELAIHPLNYSPLSITLTSGEMIIPKLVSTTEFIRSNDRNIYTASSDGKIINFKKDFIKSAIGGRITYPYYINLEEVSNNDDDIVVDNPNWLVYMLAAEIARSDIVQAGQYGNLIALAQNSMTSMKNRQRGLRIAHMDPWRIKR